MTAGHVALDRVGKLPWCDALDLFAYWRRHPPTHEIAAAMAGFKPPAPKPVEGRDSADPSGIGSLIMQFPNGFVPANR